MPRDYRYYREIFAERPMPFAFVDLDSFDTNVTEIERRAAGKPIRVATKSIRCVSLLERILKASTRFRSLMAYSAREAAFLSRKGLSDDILLAYPVCRELGSSGLRDEFRSGKRITLMVDSAEHVDLLERTGASWRVNIPVCIDVDMSSRLPGIHFGVRRSGLSAAEPVLDLFKRINGCRHLSLEGLMGYEAQIAGVQDRSPHARIRNHVVRAMKKRSVREAAIRRVSVVEALRRAGCSLRFVNGGGTGSLETTVLDESVTEVSVGSGFYSPALFDHYAAFRHHPAAAFAIEITRRPVRTIYTCHGGGYVASGAVGSDKQPVPFLPEGARLLVHEGAGEVQTPIVYEGPEALSIGDPIFMRHAKAGEFCERFSSILLISNGQIVDEVRTYRGDGLCFL